MIKKYKILFKSDINESSKFLNNKRDIADIFLSVSSEYKIKDVTESSKDGYLSTYVNNKFINHFDINNYGDKRWMLRIYVSKDTNTEFFKNDLQRFLERITKFDFNTEIYEDCYDNPYSDGYIYCFIINKE